MQQIYNTVDNSMKSYMYPKQAVTLDIKPAPVEVEEQVTEQEQEVVSVVITETEDLIKEEAVTVDPYDLKKAELIDYVQSLHGEDADVSGTKAEILARYFG